MEALPVTILSGEQRLPASMDSFWPLSGNKLQLQRFVIEWISKNYTGDKPIYLAGAHKENSSKCVLVQNNITITIPELQCCHEEADDRILYHIQHLTNDRNDVSSIVVATEDTDIVVSLLFHFKTSFKDRGLKHLWLNKGSGTKRLVYPLDILVSDIGDEIIQNHPAAHALTGADTTSKIGTKVSMMSQKNKLCLLDGFGISELSEEMFQAAAQLKLS